MAENVETLGWIRQVDGDLFSLAPRYASDSDRKSETGSAGRSSEVGSHCRMHSLPYSAARVVTFSDKYCDALTEMMVGDGFELLFQPLCFRRIPSQKVGINIFRSIVVQRNEHVN